MKFKLITAIFVLSTLVIGCKKHNPEQLKIGAMAGPETALVAKAQQILKTQYHIDSELLTFADYQLPNPATEQGDIDVNIFQHLPFFKFYQQNHPQAKLYVVGKTFVYPMGLYSSQLQQLSDLKDGAKIAIPNDPTNETRALKLLAQAKLIQLNNSALLLTVDDITDNPKKLQIITMDAASLPRTLDDVAVAAINTTYALPAHLRPDHDALIIEQHDSDYANIIVSRLPANNPKIAALVKAMHDPKVLALAQKLFKGAAIPAWTHQKT